MKMTIEQILEMKNHTNNLGINSYDYFFNNLENNSISKVDGVKRNAAIAKEYNDEAKAYILHQLFYLNQEATSDLMAKLKIEKPFISDENVKHLMRYR
ncbi:hypothetical protein [Exiguobacterium artemiae]|uniref:hypothetical protein n=1 Tax=Exiguobacterium artemiae TaxID=340145 RepID=UPI000478871E|nr:hypothetical protein [Exiguobacterium sibiricum]